MRRHEKVGGYISCLCVFMQMCETVTLIICESPNPKINTYAVGFAPVTVAVLISAFRCGQMRHPTRILALHCTPTCCIDKYCVSIRCN